MADPNVLNPNPPEFERFLYATIGEDRNGYDVTVLSALARLGLDPWTETAELDALADDQVHARLGTLLARVRDVPALASDHGRIARDLSRLLPNRKSSGRSRRVVPTAPDNQQGTWGAILAVLAVTFFLFQIFRAGGFGSIE